MRRLAPAGLILSLSLCAASPVLAQDSTAFDPAELERQFNFQQGTIVVGDSLATLAVPEGFRYLDGEQTSTLLEMWGNPPGASTLGMLFPSDVNPFADAGWGVVITFEEDGYVKDDDAEQIDYSAMLADIQASEADENKERADAGYEPVHLVGWAEPPHYDRSTHKLYWAKELQFGDSEDHTLNYNIRMLGRRGVLGREEVRGHCRRGGRHGGAALVEEPPGGTAGLTRYIIHHAHLRIRLPRLRSRV